MEGEGGKSGSIISYAMKIVKEMREVETSEKKRSTKLGHKHLVEWVKPLVGWGTINVNASRVVQISGPARTGSSVCKKAD